MFSQCLELTGRAATVLGLASKIRCFRFSYLLHETGLAAQMKMLKWLDGHCISLGGGKEPGGATSFL